MYYYIVLTNPEKEFLFVDALLKYVDKNFNEYLIVSEMGDVGANPHINCIVLMGSKRIDNVRRGILTSYYGPKLSDLEKNPNFNKYGAVGKNIKDKENLKNTCNYLKKEDDNEYYYFKGIDIYLLTEGMLPYKEHQKLLESNATCVRSAEQLLLEMINNYKRECMEDTLNAFVVDFVPPPPSKSDFVRQLKLLAIKKYILTPLTSKMKIYYIEFMSRLGNYDQLENLVDRVDEELSRSRN